MAVTAVCRWTLVLMSAMYISYAQDTCDCKCDCAPVIDIQEGCGCPKPDPDVGFDAELLKKVHYQYNVAKARLGIVGMGLTLIQRLHLNHDMRGPEVEAIGEPYDDTNTELMALAKRIGHDIDDWMISSFPGTKSGEEDAFKRRAAERQDETIEIRGLVPSGQFPTLVREFFALIAETLGAGFDQVAWTAFYEYLYRGMRRHMDDLGLPPGKGPWGDE